MVSELLHTTVEGNDMNQNQQKGQGQQKQDAPDQAEQRKGAPKPAIGKEPQDQSVTGEPTRQDKEPQDRPGQPPQR